MVREVVRELVENEEDMTVVAEVSDLTELRDRVVETGPDVVVLTSSDLEERRLPLLLRRDKPDLRIVGLSRRGARVVTPPPATELYEIANAAESNLIECLRRLFVRASHRESKRD